MFKKLLIEFDFPFFIKIGYGFSMGYMLYEYVFYKKNPTQLLSWDFLIGVGIFVTFFVLDRVVERRRQWTEK